MVFTVIQGLLDSLRLMFGFSLVLTGLIYLAPCLVEGCDDLQSCIRKKMICYIFIVAYRLSLISYRLLYAVCCMSYV